MRVAIIAPTRFLNRYSTTGYHLALAHQVLTDPDYRDFYDMRSALFGEYVILDNSMIELNTPLSPEELVQACKMIRPDELILPDWRDDPPRTYHAAQELPEFYKAAFPNMKLMAVPHYYGSADPKHWQENYNEICDLEGIDSIGIGKYLRALRPDIIEWLDVNRAEHVEHHLLGTWSWLKEVATYVDYKWIRGIDSKAPVRLGMAGVVLHPESGLIVPELRDACPAMTLNEQVDHFPIVTQHNVETFISWAEARRPADVLHIRP